jgi:hypothetical protein
LLIVNSNTFSDDLRANATLSTANNNTQVGSTTNNVILSTVKKIRVRDLDIAYRMFGKGEALLLIPGSSMRTDDWEPNTLNKLASNHTVIVLDNRGIGNTTAGNKTWSIEQFANDTAALLDALYSKLVTIMEIHMERQ